MSRCYYNLIKDYLSRNLFYIILISGLIIFSSILISQLMFPPVIGLADSGDFYRLMDKCGISYINEKDILYKFLYVTRIYKVGWSNGPFPYYSSEIIFLWLSRIFNYLFFKDRLFDIRCLGFIHICFMLIASKIFLNYFNKISIYHGLIAIFLFFFIFSDTGYFSYFNSFFSESSSLIFLILSLGVLFITTEEKKSKYNILFFILALLFLIGKPQNVVLAPLLLFLWWWNSGKLNYKKTDIIISVIIIVISIFYFSTRPFKEINLYNNVFANILLNTSETSKALVSLGLDESYSSLIGTKIWLSKDDNRIELRDKALNKLSFKNVLIYYIKNPESFINLMSRGAKDAFIFRPDYLGNFELPQILLEINDKSLLVNSVPPEKIELLLNKKISTEELIIKLNELTEYKITPVEIKTILNHFGLKAQEHSKKFSHMTCIKEKYYPHNIFYLLVIFVIFSLISLLILKNDKMSGNEMVIAKTSMCLLLMSVIQFFAVMLGEGNDVVKQLFLFNILFDLSLILNILLIYSLCKNSYEWIRKKF